MTEQDSPSLRATELRRRATEQAGSDWPEPLEPRSPEETRRTLHELRVHQIELEMQNEELRLTQVELEASRARYFDLYDLAPVGYLTLNDKGLILEANLTCAALLDVPRAELTRCHLSRFVLLEDHDAYYLGRRHLFDSDGPMDFELRMLRGETPFWAQLKAGTPETIGGVAACRMAISDISESKKLDEAKERIKAQVQQLRKAESLGRMAGAIAHHFNNMLSGVLGNLELAMGDVPRAGGAWELLDEAMRAGKRAAEVSGLMLTYLGQASGEREVLDLAGACSLSLLALRPIMPRSIILQADLPSSGPIVSANASHLRQVVSNLVTNAWEALGEPPSPIQLSVKLVDADAIDSFHRFPVEWSPSDDAYACIEVADRGGGIPSTDVPNLFDPFFSSKFVGRGLGLAVVLGIARAHGGAVTVDTKLGEGSTFRVYFPLSPQGLPQPVDMPASGAVRAGPATVLLVDDEEMVLTMTTIMLERLGFTVLQAKSGAQAIEVFRQRGADIHCVLCDVTMPGIGGWETLEMLRTLAPAISVVLASGYSEGQVMEGKRDQQPDAFLAKPFGLDALNAAICRALGRAAS